MKNLLRYALACVIICAACSRNEVSITDTNFEKEAPIAGNLTFHFSHALAPDSLIDTWLNNEYIAFEPRIVGKFKWASKSELIFAPERPLNPASSYTATPTQALLEYYQGKKMTLNTKSIGFHTPYLALESTKSYWAKIPDQPATGYAHFAVNFNYDVKPSDAAQAIKVNVNGTKTDFRILTKNNSRQIELYLPTLPIEDKTKDVKITIDKGLNVAGGNLPTAQAFEQNIELPSPSKMEIEEVVSSHDGTLGVIYVYTTQQVKPENLKKLVVLDPAIPFEIDVHADGFSIESEKFDPEQIYKLTIKEGIQGSISGTTKSEYEENISFGKLEPEIAFTSKKGMYLAAQGNKNIGVKITNIDKIKVSIIKIYENNLIQYLNSGYQGYDGDYEGYYYEYGSSPEQYGDIAFEKNYETDKLPKSGFSKLLKMDFVDKLSAYDGVYVAQVRSEDEEWRSDTKLFSVSDIGLITKVGKGNVMIFANSIANAQPMAGVEIRLIGRNNQLIGKAKTDNNGVAIYALDANAPAGFTPQLITAKLGTDINFLPFNATQASTADFEVDGTTENLSGFDGFLYGDRNIYRPGESINLACILRNTNSGTTPNNIPIKINLTAPDGSNITTLRKNTNAQGTFDVSIALSNAAATGIYTAELLSGNDVLINSTRIAVEEFLPDKIKVDAKLNATSYAPADQPIVNLTATNLFGPPAAGRNYTALLNIKRKMLNSKSYPEYNFNINAENTYFEEQAKEGKTDADGKASIGFEISPEYADMGVLQADFFVTVFDETARPVNRRLSAEIYTQKAFFGIRNQDYYQSNNTLRRIEFMAINDKGVMLNNVPAVVKIIKTEYENILTKSDSYFRYESQKVEKTVLEKQIIINDKNTAINFTPTTSGDYEVRIMRPDGKTYVSQNFWSYGYGSTSNTAFEVNTDGKIDIKLDKESYKVGESANVVLSAPFAGKVLVTIEGSDVQQHFYVNTDGKSAQLTLPILSDFAPNVYISATLFRPHQRYDLPLTVAHGTVPLLVENPANKLPITIDAPKQIRSNTQPVINIKTAPNASVTVAVVDEGILQLTGYKTPDPYNFFYAKRALQVMSYDIYPYLFPELLARTGKLSGDGLGAGKRINPMTNKRTKLVALWSGILQADADGNISYPITIPQFAGSLRVMAVAHSSKAYTNATATNIQVADPVVISTPLPRFFSPRDSIDVPVLLTNTTSKPIESQAQITATGAVQILGSSSQNVSLAPNSEKQVNFRVIALPAIGEAKIIMTATANNEKFSQTTDISVRPTSPLQKRSGSGVVDAGQTANFTFNNADFIQSTKSNSVLMSRSPIAQFSKNLEYLIGYPYGCVEQTVSSAFPQLYVQDLAQEFMQTKIKNYNSAYNIQGAIKSLQLFQVYNGGLAYWSGAASENWWGSVYAAHFLIEARTAGYEVNKDFLDKLLGFIRTNLKQKKTVKYYYNGTQNREISSKEVPYSLFVLALAGEKNIPSLNFYKSRPELLSLEGKYLIAAAYMLSGDKNKFKDMLPKNFAGENANKELSGSFDSQVRSEALALYVLAETEPDNPQIGIMSKHVSEYLKQNKYLSTQENAFALLALGKIARKLATNNATATLTSGGKTVANYDGKSALILKNPDLKNYNNFALTASGGRIFYFYESEGISSTGNFVQEDSYLSVRRSFFTRTGQPINKLVFYQNELVVVKIALQSTNNLSVENVVISDLLPAGLEIENPRISELPELTWITNASEPQHRDMRDDRINMFVTATPTTQYYYYVCRAVSLGSFALAPISADAMYDGSYHSYHGAGRVLVKRK